MENTYVRPTLSKYGNSRNVIKGDCGWGVENATLDKTGYYYGSYKDEVLVSRVTLLAGPWLETYECQYTDHCDNGDDC